MADASRRDLSQFSKWYEIAGTPVVSVKTDYNAETKEYRLELSQHTPDTPKQSNKPALHIPLSLALLAEDGSDLTLHPQENAAIQNGLFEFTTATAVLTFRNIAKRPLLSINRNFSAPIILRHDVLEDDLLSQMGLDQDGFNRWEAAQASAMRLFRDAYKGKIANTSKFARGLAATLSDETIDTALKALMLQLPSEAEFTVAIGLDVDANRIHACRRHVLAEIAQNMKEQLFNVFETSDDTGEYSADTQNVGQRSLRLAALSLLSFADASLALSLAQKDFAAASNMTMEAGSVASVLTVNDPAVDQMLAEFYRRHHADHLLVDKWFMLQAARASSAQDIEKLTGHTDFTFKTPNRVYALIGGFTGANLNAFHAADGAGYRILGESIVTLNAINPQVAARMANGFRSWGRYDESRKAHSSATMQKILAHPGLSNDVYEIISRTLNV